MLFGIASFLVQLWISDHSPLLISCNIQMGGGSRPFKFFNYMVDHANFLEVVKKGWDSDCQGKGAMLQVLNKLKSVKQGLKTLYHQKISRLNERIEIIRDDLSKIQSQLADFPDDVTM